MRRIYLDHNAGSPLRPEVVRALEELAAGNCGNPSSIHMSGQRARRELERAREAVACAVGAKPSQIVFTSGGTEANNLAILGAVRGRGCRRVVSSAVEHSSVLAPLAQLKREGFEAVLLSCDSEGRISASDLGLALGSATALVTIGLANSEVGTLQDIAALGASVRQHDALFHIDAAQALGRVALDVGTLGCDLMTLSGHKVGAPAGIGALYVRDRSIVEPIMLGGPQEQGLRAGTQNLSGAVGFGVAIRTATKLLAEEAGRMGFLAERLWERLREEIPGLRRNGSQLARIPNTLNLTFPAVEGETMLIALDLAGVEVSMGSACAAGAVEPSHVLLAMGRSRHEARSSLRLSLGWSSTAEEIGEAAARIVGVWRRVAQAEPAGVREAAQ